MITLRLYRQADPFHQLEARTLEQGELVIGRGADADWTLPDPMRMLSRRHCVIAVAGTRIAVRDTSINGVLVGEAREPAPSGAPRQIELTDVLRLGEYLIVLDASEGSDAVSPPGVDEDAASPSPASEESLLEAFCEGAQLDASAFSGEAPEAVMRRLGEVYRQMILGLTDLMSERTTLKARYRMERTSVRAAGNNPFRWTDAQRVAVDLLREGDDGFLSGPAAVTASFGDVKKHMLCVMDGLRASLEATLDALSPEAVEERIAGRSFVLKARSAAAWAEFALLHDQIRSEVSGNADSVVNREFNAAYADRLAALDRASAGR